MFTGIISERGRVVSIDGGDGGVRLRIAAPAAAEATREGGSVAVNGVCLTAVSVENETISFDAVPETLGRSSLGRLQPGAEVNIELPLRVGDVLGGHIVQGHVDGVGHIRRTEPEGDGLRIWIEATPDVLRYCVEKGSVAVEGVSLTVAELDVDALVVALVPFTLAETTLGGLAPSDEVNLEVDVLAKYVEKLASRAQGLRSTER